MSLVLWGAPFVLSDISPVNGGNPRRGYLLREGESIKLEDNRATAKPYQVRQVRQLIMRYRL